MSRGPKGRRMDSGVVVVTLDGSGDGTADVTFAETGFVAAPQIMVVEDAADAEQGATYEATDADTNGFTVEISGSALVSRDVEVVWIACERG